MKKGELELIDYAIYFATKAHTGQKRKSEKNVDMIFHPFTVGMILQRAGANTNCVIAGLLHDVVEDTDMTFLDLEKFFSSEVIEILKLLTRDKRTDYMEYIKKIKPNKVAKKIKIADIIHNSDETRLDVIDEETIKRRKRYQKALKYLKEE